MPLTLMPLMLAFRFTATLRRVDYRYATYAITLAADAAYVAHATIMRH